MANAGDIDKVVLSLGLDPKAKADVDKLLKSYKALELATRNAKRNIQNITAEKGTEFKGVRAKEGQRKPVSYGVADARTQVRLEANSAQQKALVKDFEAKLQAINSKYALGDPKQLSKVNKATQAFQTGMVASNKELAALTKSVKAQQSILSQDKKLKKEERAFRKQELKETRAASKTNRAELKTERDVTRREKATAAKAKAQVTAQNANPLYNAGAAKNYKASLTNDRNKNLIKRNEDGGAGLLRNQATLLQNYAILGGAVGAGYSAGSFVLELDKSFKQLQSIVALTNTEMKELSTSIIDISEKTKFTAVEVADAAIVLGQAGFGKDQISVALESVTLFATAVGTDLKSAVDLATSTLGVYNKSANQMPQIVDKMTVAINNSKLNMDKLSLGLQYAGNIAAQSNVSFEETVSALSAMANSGIRSGSTLGTGLRQILIALQKPSEGLKNVLKNLGIGMDDIDLKTHGLIGVMKNLAEGGFTVTDAMKTMQVRAGAAFSAFVNNIDVAEDIATQMQLGGAAAKANAVQMEALTNQWSRFTAIYKSIFFLSFEPVLESLTAMVKGLGTLGQSIKELGPLLPILGSFLGISVLLGAGKRVGKLGAGFLKDGKVLSRFKGLLSGGAVAAAGAAGGAASKASTKTPKVSSGLLKKIGFAALGFLGGWAGLIAAAVVAVGALGYSYAKDLGSRGLDKAQADVNKTEAEVSRQVASDKKLNEVYSKVLQRERVLTQGDKAPDLLKAQIKEINDEFRGLGFYLDESKTGFKDLLAELLKFKGSTLNKIVELSPKRVNETAALTNEKIKASFKGGGELDRLVNGTLSPSASTYTPNFAPTPYGSLGTIQQGTEDLDALLSPTIDFVEFTSTLKDLGSTFKALDPKEAGSGESYRVLEAEYSSLAARLTQRINGGDDDEANKAILQEIVDRLLVKIELTKTSGIEAKQIQANTPDPITGNTPTQREALINNDYIRDIGTKLNKRRSKRELEISEILRFAAEQGDVKTALAAYNQLSVIIDQNKKDAADSRVQFGLLLEKYGGTLNSPEGVSKSYELIEKSLNQISKQGLEAQQELVPKAKIIYDRETNATLKAYKAEYKKIDARKKDSRNSNEIADLETALITLLENISSLELEAATKFGDEGTDSGVDFASQQARKNLLGLATDSKRVSDIGALQDETDLQLENARIYEELLAGEFNGVFDSSKVTDKELAKVLKQYLKGKLLTINNTFAAAQKDLLTFDESYTSIQRNVDLSQRFTGDSGVSSVLRKQSLVGEGNLQRSAVANRQERARAEQGNLDAANTSLAKEIAVLQATLRNTPSKTEPDSANKIKAMQQTIVANDTKRAELELKLQELGIEMKDVTFNNEVKQLQAARERSGFMSDRQLQINAYTSGSGYTTASGTEVSAQSSNGGGLFEGAQNGGLFALDELDSYYEGYNALGEAVEAITVQGKAMGDAFGDAFFQFASGAATAGEAARGFLLGFLADLGATASKIAANQLMQMIISYASSFFTAGSGLNAGNATNQSTAGTLVAYQGGHQTAGNYFGGGEITSGQTSRDSTLVNVAKGEFVLRRAAVNALGIDSVRAMNSMDPNNMTKATEGLQGMAIPKDAGSGDKTVNVYVVSPESKPQTTNRNEVIAIISDDMVRNGQTKQLIKQINIGAL